MQSSYKASVFSGLTKGVPLTQENLSLSEIGNMGWNLLREDLPLPVAVLRSSALDHNSAIMRNFLSASAAFLAPHGKTTMSPQLFQQQFKDGAWGLTVATPQQILVARHLGYKRIVLANQLIGSSAIRFVLGELKNDPEFDFYCLVDSVEGVRRLTAEMNTHPLSRPLQVLVELGVSGLRCGCRTKEEALRVARAVAESGGKLALRGVEGFEGLIVEKDGNFEPVVQFLELIVETAKLLDQENLFSGKEILLTAGGSNYLDLVAKTFEKAVLSLPVRVILRSGCYLIHDSGMYVKFEKQRENRMNSGDNAIPKAQAALEVWAYVQSIPEPSLAILNAGKRDCSHDAGLPVPLKWFRPGLHTQPVALGSDYSITGLSDQHAHMRIPSGESLKVGDLIGLGISHPCTTFDKWKVLYIVDDNYQVTSAIETFF